MARSSDALRIGILQPSHKLLGVAAPSPEPFSLSVLSGITIPFIRFDYGRFVLTVVEISIELMNQGRGQSLRLCEFLVSRQYRPAYLNNALNCKRDNDG